MAHIQSHLILEGAKPEPIYIGEEEDRCFICNRNLNGENCLKLNPDNTLICLDEQACNQRAVEGSLG